MELAVGRWKLERLGVDLKRLSSKVKKIIIIKKNKKTQLKEPGQNIQGCKEGKEETPH